MNDLQIFSNSEPETIYTDRTPIEILLQVGEDDRVSAKNVYDFLELHPKHYARWCRTNFENNEFAEEHEDYEGSPLMVNGNLTLDYRLSVPFAKKLCMLSKTPRGEEARDYFIKVEDTLKKVAQRLPAMTHNEILLQTFQGMVEMEHKQAALESRMETTEQIVLESAVKLENSLKVFSKPGNNWKDSMELAIREMADGSGWALIKLKGKLYQELEIVANVDIQSRLTRKRNRMKKQGTTRKEYMAVNKLDIISHDKQLRPIFEGIVKRYQAVYA